MSVNEDEYADVLDLINEAALDHSKWINVLRRLADITKCVAGGLTLEDSVTGVGSPITYFGFDPDHVDKVFDYYLPMNPVFKLTPRLRAGAVLSNSMAVTLESFTRSEFYSGWAKPQELCCAVTVVLRRQNSSFLPLTLVRPDGSGDVETSDIELLERLAPSLQRALSVSIRLQTAETERLSFRKTIDHLGLSVFLIGKDGSLEHVNPSGEDLVRLQRGVTIKHKRLTTLDQSNKALQDAIDAAVSGLHNEVVTVAIEREFERPLIAKVVPVSNPGAESFGIAGIRCAVMIASSSAPTRSQEQAIATAYRLTRAEAALLQALMLGHDLAEAAASLGVSKSTVQTHLKGIFAKTGVNRQSELIRLVLSSSAVLREAPSSAAAHSDIGYGRVSSIV